MKVITYTIYVGFASRDGDTSSKFVYTNRGLLHDLVDYHLGEHGATILPASGFFGGHPEPGACVVVITPEDTRDRVAQSVHRTAAAYRDQAEQLEVWVTTREETLDKI
jgi:hypothetical protein